MKRATSPKPRPSSPDTSRRNVLFKQRFDTEAYVNEQGYVVIEQWNGSEESPDRSNIVLFLPEDIDAVCERLRNITAQALNPARPL